MINKIKKIYEEVKSEGEELLISYFGPIKEENLEKILNNLEKKTSQFSNKVKRKIFLITVEMIQNLYHHSTNKENQKELNSCIFTVTSNNNNSIFKFTTGNFITHEELLNLEAKINQVNQLSNTEIRSLYKKVLGNNKFSNKGGGGLGIIDIKRKSELPLKINKIYFNKNLYFFNFIVFLKNKN